MLFSESVDIDGESVLEPESLRLIVTSDCAGETLVGESIKAVLFAPFEPAFGGDGVGGGSREGGCADAKLDIVIAGLVAHAMRYGVVYLGVSAAHDGGAALGIVTKEIVQVLSRIEGRGQEGVDVVEDALERLRDAFCLHVSIRLGESERVGVVGVSMSIVRREQCVDLCEVGEGARLCEGERDSSTDSEAIGVENRTFVTMFHPLEMDLNTVWIGGGKVVEIAMKAVEVASREVSPILDFPKSGKERKVVG